MSPKYSVRASRGLARLKRHFNDIEIFVEDTKNPNMWVELIRNIIPSHIRFKSVNQLGGREKVIAACKADQAIDNRKKLYIIDGDFDHLLGRKKPRLKFLYRIKAYCVENILLNQKSVASIGAASKPDWLYGKVISEFSFRSWLNEASALMIPLFRAYAVAHHLAPNLETTGHSVTNFYKDTPKGPIVDKTKIEIRISNLIKSIRQTSSKEEVRSCWNMVDKNIKNLSVEECVSGKDYLIPIFHLRLCKVLSFQGKSEQLKVHLARSFDHRMEPWLCRRLRALCG